MSGSEASQLFDNSVGTRLKHEECAPTPDLLAVLNNNRIFKSQHTPLQQIGVSFMLEREMTVCHNQFGGLICDALGTGKGFQTLSTIAVSKVGNLHAVREITLVVAPANIIHTWVAESEKHLQPGVLKVMLYHGAARKNVIEEIWRTADVVVTTYGTLAAEYGYHEVDGVEVESIQEGSLLASPLARPFFRMVLDEAHHIRSLKTEAFRTVERFITETTVRWCISATPVWNTLEDIYALLKFLHAEPLCYRACWVTETSITYGQSRAVPITKIINFLAPIMIRRDKTSLNLPPKREVVQLIRLNESERLFYDSLYTNCRNKIKRLLEVERWLRKSKWAKALRARASMNMYSVFLRLRQTCVHPQIVLDVFDSRFKHLANDAVEQVKLFEAAVVRLRQENLDELCCVCLTNNPNHCAVPCGHKFCPECCDILERLQHPACPICRGKVDKYQSIEEALLRAVTNDEDVVIEEAEIVAWSHASSKFQFIIDDMHRRLTLDPHTKFLVFSQWTTVIALFSKFLALPHLTYTGKQSPAKRNEIQNEFYTSPNYRVLLVSLMAGGQGLNLQCASVVYHMDSWWTAARTDQASERVYRIGQIRDTTIIHLVCAETVEERVFRIQNQKRILGEQIFRGARGAHVIQEVMELNT